jgi:hypothetical protein|uniref:Uncharacterized protein n=1 Tax=viral metagenome TaxID=1070528 RepID=A0A6C0J8P5_9ZZZZ|tara:strand:- start:1315 stop:1527 length:213 start_codon:yes stop_codon:yes gene_type:complete
MIDNLYKTRTGRYIISIILGLGISALFRKVCNDRDCLIINGPPSNEIEGNIYDFDSKCYKYRVKNTSCKK